MFNKCNGVRMKKLIIILALVLLSSVVYADYKCYTLVTQDDNVIQINPKQSEIYAVGIIDYFEPQPSGSKYQYVQVYFTAEDLKNDIPVNFSVICAGDNQTITFERSVTPTFKSLEETIDWTIWVRDNVSFLFVMIGILIIIFIIIGILIARLRNR